MHPTTRLDIELAAACAPASVVGVTRIAPTEWSVQWADKATDADRAAAAKVLAGFDPAMPDADSIKTECSRRIFAIANSNAQMNMASFAAAGLFSASQMTAYTSGLQWVAAMRAKCAALIAAADPAFTNDASWPQCPQAAAALAAQF